MKMKNAFIIVLMAIMLATTVMAENCVTILNAPGNDRLFWKATGYDQITSANDLARTPNYYANPGLGVGTIYSMRVDKDCFNSYLLTSNAATGLDSGAIFIQKDNDDYKNSPLAKNTMYSVSKKALETDSNGYVKDITTGNIGGINYLSKPTNINTKFPNYDNMTTGLCGNYKVKEQIQRVALKVQDAGITNSKDASILAAALGRQCGVPTRIIFGISEGQFNGVNILFDESYEHYWIEYYDKGWHTLDVAVQSNEGPKTIETTCLDGTDNDNDGLIDCRDPDCSSQFYCQGNWPTTTRYNNVLTTDLTKLTQAYRINSLVIGNEFGDITFKDQAIDLRNKNLDNMIDLLSNKATITGFNKPASIKLVGIFFSNPNINKDGSSCNTCKITSYSNNMLTFSVPGDGTYTATQAIPTNTTIQPPSNVTLPPTVTPSTDYGAKFGQIKNLWTGLSTGAKATLIAVIILIIYLIYRHNKKKNYFPRP